MSGAFSKACFVLSVYACINHHTHNNVHQKYLVTTANTLKIGFQVRTVSIGFHAVLLGSQSSFALS
jgi:hypothetical protein